jgi:histidine triad (HIT) family protein
MDKLSSLKTELFNFLLKFGRMRITQPLLSYFFNHTDQLLPVDRIYENKHWLAFHHPRPDYPLHILILPKRAIRSLMDISNEEPEFYKGLFEVVKALIVQHQLEGRAYRLITNGGSNQSIPQLHWHLVSDKIGGKDA